MKLTDEDKAFLDSCSESGSTVWENIKKAITNKKYEWYICELKKVMKSPKKTSQLAEIEERWNAAEIKHQYRMSEEFDLDLEKILVWYASNLRGTPTSDKNGWNIGARIRAWKKAEYFKSRSIALRTAVAFGFTLDETRKLLFSSMSEENQNDINPRDLSEMIYLSAIIQELPLYESNDTDAVANLIEYAEIKYLENVFGEMNCRDYYGFSESFTNGDFSEFDISVCDSEMIEVIAFLLAAHSSGKCDVPKAALNIIKNATWAKWCFNIGDIDVYKYEQKYGDTSQKVYQEYTIRLEMPKSELNHVFVEMINDLEKLEALHKEEDSLCVRICRTFIEGLMNSLTYNTNNNIHVFPFISNSMNQIAKTINEFVTTTEQAQIVIDWTRSIRDRYGYLRRCKFDDIVPESVKGKLSVTKLNCEKCTVAIKIFDCMIIVLKSLKQFKTDENLSEFFDIFCNANQILEYTFFSVNGVGQRIKERNNEAATRDDDDVDDSGRTYTVTALQTRLKLAEKSSKDFIDEVLSDVYIYEAIDPEYISRGRRMVVSYLEDGSWLSTNGKGTLIAKASSKVSALFKDMENSAEFDNISEQFTSNFENFYSGSLFSKQWDKRTQSFSRNDIVKLCFWDYATNPKNYPSKMPFSKANVFVKKFNSRVSILACCSDFSLSNPHDRLLNYCLCQKEPISFLMAALDYNPNLFKNTKNEKEVIF